MDLYKLLFSCSLMGLLYTGTASAGYSQADTLAVMSYNIRYNNPGDGVNAWPHRKEHVADMIGRRYTTDIVGLQEALKEQIDYLEKQLSDYSWIGVGRDDGGEKGEFTPIFYRHKRFELLNSDTFWLSEHPKEPGSKSWDAAITRIVTWAHLKDRSSNKSLYFFNTHFDHRGEKARLESAKLLVQKISEIAGGEPYVVTGDFNFPESAEPYAVVTDKEGLEDARYASKTGHNGPTSSTNNWEKLSGDNNRIDYIFVKDDIRVLDHHILDDKFGKYYPSDHLPVLSKLVQE